MKISYTSPFNDKEIVTGGQMYDKDLTNIVSNKTPHSVEFLHLDAAKLSNNLILAPFSYLFKTLKDKNTDIYLFNSAFFMRFLLLPFFIRKIKKKHAIAVHHHFMHRQFSGLKKLIYRHFEWSFLNQMDKIIIASPYVYDELLKVYPKEKLLFYQIPFDAKQKYTPNPVKGNLVYAGTIEYRKGLNFLLEALIELKKRNRDYNLTIIGKVTEKDYYDSIKKLISENDLNVTFTGFLSRDEKDRYMAQADLFVFPSLLEGYGMVLVEAQVYGLPIVSFDNSAMPYNVKNDFTGYAVPTGNALAFADAIEKIVEDRLLREKLSEGAYKNLEAQNSFKKFEDDIISSFNNLSF